MFTYIPELLTAIIICLVFVSLYQLKTGKQLKSLLESKEKEIARLLAAIDETKKTHNEASEQLKELLASKEREIESLSASLHKAGLEHEDASRQLNALLAKVDNLHDGLHRTELQNADARKQLKELILAHDEASKQLKVYQPFENRILELSKLGSEIQTMQHELRGLNEQKQRISDDYSEGRQTYIALNKEIALLEDTLEIYSFGLYTPHFDFGTSEQFKSAIMECYEECKAIVKAERAVFCQAEWTVNGSRTEGKRQTKHYAKMMLRAFNGECDAAIIKTKWNNVKAMEERIRKSFEAVNKLGETHQISILPEYLEVRLRELYLTYEHQEKIRDEREEQRRIREQMREEERSLKEMENARIEAEKEEKRYLRALSKAQQELETKHGIEKDNLQKQICELEKHLAQATELKERAISMAQITKAGHVYVISNVGAFGESVFKIGMTRRLDPEDRVRELGGASVPFGFDIHAMIYSVNAPELENNFHKKFRNKRLNWVNGRKEFFNVTLDEIEAYTFELNHKIEFTKIAEARDYRETKARIQQYLDSNGKFDFESKYPESLFLDDIDSEEATENYSIH